MSSKLISTLAGLSLLVACAPQAEQSQAEENTQTSSDASTVTALAGAQFSEDGTQVSYKVPSEWPHHAETSGAITAEDFAYRIATLSDDRFKGRGPASEGGEESADWLAAEMDAIGLQPAGLEGSWFQPVPLIESTLDEGNSSFEITISGEPMGIEVGTDVTYWTQNPVDNVTLDSSDLVFVGYGVVAPEFGWNDYAGVDMTGKTAVILVNDPGFVNPQGEAFKGEAMTYYGRWTYKYEEAARQGAEGAIIIHQSEPASYGWGTVRASWSGPQFILASGANNDYVDVQSWIQESTATRLFEAVGLNFAELYQAAGEPGFTPVEMTGANLTADLYQSFRELTSRNVAGMIEGSERPNEYVLFMAHWDHIGERLNFAGDDQIYNGAVDNASGTTAILEIAEQYAANESAPDRSVIFVAVTAEEQGLLGSEYYAQEPLIPLNQTVAGFNFDGMLPIGPTSDIVVIGYGSSELEDLLRSEAEKIDISLTPDPNASAGYYYRSDHVTLARRGVPMLYADSGSIHAELGADYGAQIETGYRLERYHKPTDAYLGAWDMRGFVESTQLMYDTARLVTESEDWPNWYEGNEFRAIRDEQMSEN